VEVKPWREIFRAFLCFLPVFFVICEKVHTFVLDMQWTDRIRQVKIILVIAAIVIAVVSLLVSHYLVKDLSNEERNKMETWAEALNALNNADENTDMSLVLKVIQSNNTIPVIVMDSDGVVSDYRNIEMTAKTASDSMAYVSRYGRRMYDTGNYIKIYLTATDSVAEDSLEVPDESRPYTLVCYDESTLLKRLSQYPYWQLGVVMIFVVVAIFALLASKRAEQNKVWVGLSKETAHQLGTPISSLMAWVEILKENYPDDELIPEMNKDVKRLELIAERFSKIGSLPEPVDASMNEVLAHVVDYMDRRTSKKVEIVRHLPEQEVIVKMNAQLFEWVIENLCKNAVDAMEGKGRIDLTLADEGNRISIEVADNGKGIRKKDVKNVFTPGFTTKKRGWGLGLSLAKRIVEEYHKGKIFVKESEVGKGTTFRIELKVNG
jgi:nitrogen-specific signal transduction histidine kinase